MSKRAKRAHTPIVSGAQRGLMGAELSRRRRGKRSRMPSMTTAELESHLRESRGKDLPERTTDGRKPRPKRAKRRA